MLLKTYIFYLFYFSFFHICICIYPFLTTLAAWFSIPSLKSWIPHIVRSWNLQQRVSLTTDTDWRWHYLGHVTHTFTYQEPILKLGKTEKWHHHSTFFLGRIYLSKFQIDSTSKSQDMTSCLFLQTSTGLYILAVLKNGIICSSAEVRRGWNWNFRKVASKFSSLKLSFNTITQLILELL